MTKPNLFYRFQQFIILVLHLVLLKWIFYTLQNSGAMETHIVFFHFFGMAVFGALLIRGCAWWARAHWIKELKEKDDENHNN